MAKEDYMCIYCGDEHGDTRDHVIPVSYTSIKRNYSVGQIVPACRECNRALGSKVFSSLSEKAKYLLKYYKKKYRKILNLPEWSDENLEDMNEGFQDYIKSSYALRDFIETKLRNLEHVSGSR